MYFLYVRFFLPIGYYFAFLSDYSMEITWCFFKNNGHNLVGCSRCIWMKIRYAHLQNCIFFFLRKKHAFLSLSLSFQIRRKTFFERERNRKILAGPSRPNSTILRFPASYCLPFSLSLLPVSKFSLIKKKFRNFPSAAPPWNTPFPRRSWCLGSPEGGRRRTKPQKKQWRRRSRKEASAVAWSGGRPPRPPTWAWSSASSTAPSATTPCGLRFSRYTLVHTSSLLCLIFRHEFIGVVGTWHGGFVRCNAVALGYRAGFHLDN